jgi:dolichol-phosphate mannosyltransferase
LEKIVIIPTYNERENILAITDAVFALQRGYHILVIDDNSPDGTAQLVEEQMQRFPGQLFLIRRSGKLGLGTAYIKGFEWALERGYQYIMEMDADFSHNPADLERLYEVCHSGEADVAIGSRYVPGGKTENWPLASDSTFLLCARNFFLFSTIEIPFEFEFREKKRGNDGDSRTK